MTDDSLKRRSSQQNNKKHPRKKVPWVRTIVFTLLVLGFGFLGYGGYEIYVASSGVQHVMKQSKTIKEVYGQGAKGQQEHQNRVTFDKLYYKYMKSDDSTLINVDKGIPKDVTTKLTTLSKSTGTYYQDSYVDKAKEFALVSSIQNDYISLWQKGHVKERFAKSTRPSTVYLFNANHYNDLQTLLAINANSQYPVWMTTQMQGIGNDAIKVESLIQGVSRYFNFPTLTKAWYVPHSYTTNIQSSLLSDYNSLGYKWNVLSFLPNLLEASSAAGSKNEEMQTKVDQANAQIASIRASSIASSEAKAASESIASSEKAASESSAKSSSEAAESSRRAEKDAESQSSSQNANSSRASSSEESSSSSIQSSSSSTSSSSSSSSSDDMPNYVGRSVELAIAWAQQHNVKLMTQIVNDGQHDDNEVISQSKNGDTYYVSYYKSN